MLFFSDRQISQWLQNYGGNASDNNIQRTEFTSKIKIYIIILLVSCLILGFMRSKCRKIITGSFLSLFVFLVDIFEEEKPLLISEELFGC